MAPMGRDATPRTSPRRCSSVKAVALEEFLAAEELDPTALPFLHPLQHAVDSLPGAQDVFDLFDPKRAGPDGPTTPPTVPPLPMFPG
jgi:hypothetical protein